MIILISFAAFAKDFGIEGHVFPIIEEDILKVIEKRLANIDMDKVNRKMQEETKAYVERPTPVSSIKKAKKNREIFFDPTYILPEDIYDHNHQLIHVAGTKVNPLEHVPLRENLAFIDGDDESQVKLALKYPNRLKIILVKGSPLQIQREHKIWIYFDQAGFITKKLGITEIPAFVEQDGLKLKIKIIGEESYE
jgi:conjugal transfer pilus assembly protein TraW